MHVVIVGLDLVRLAVVGFDEAMLVVAAVQTAAAKLEKVSLARQKGGIVD